MDQKFFTTEQVANILQVHPFTILRYLKEGKLQGIKLGRVYRIMESDVKIFLEERMTVAKSPKVTSNLKAEQSEASKIEKDEVHKKLEPAKKTTEPKEPTEETTGQYQISNKNDQDDHYYII